MKLLVCIAITCIFFACKKDASVEICPEPPYYDTVKPKIRFEFINKVGFKSDSNSMRWFQAVNLYSKFYNPLTNNSNLVNTVYNRNYIVNDFRLKDSIVHKTYNNVVGAQYAYEISISWSSSLGTQFGRVIKFNTKNWPNACDTIENARDTVIKFIYPDDTLPNNKFIRVM